MQNRSRTIPDNHEAHHLTRFFTLKQAYAKYSYFSSAETYTLVGVWDAIFGYR
jgi:hypothetical protein